MDRIIKILEDTRRHLQGVNNLMRDGKMTSIDENDEGKRVDITDEKIVENEALIQRIDNGIENAKRMRGNS